MKLKLPLAVTRSRTTFVAVEKLNPEFVTLSSKLESLMCNSPVRLKLALKLRLRSTWTRSNVTSVAVLKLRPEPLVLSLKLESLDGLLVELAVTGY